jgi:hypothetical protein
MSDQTTDLHHVKMATAALLAMLVQTLNESDGTFEARFLERLAKGYREFRDNAAGDVRHQLELLSWTRELLTGFNMVEGQGKPFLAD